MSRSLRIQNVQPKPSELSLLYEISLLLDQSLDLGKVAQKILQLVVEHACMLHASLSLLNRQSGEIAIDAAFGLSRTEMAKGRYRFGEGVTGRVVETGKPAVVEQVSKDPVFLDRTGARKRRGKELSYVCVPVKIGREVIGTLGADRFYAQGHDLKDDLHLLSVVASMIAQAVKLRQSIQEERQRLLEENRRLQAELQARFRPGNIIGNSQTMQAVYEQMEQVAPTDATVLVRGETGTGKELVAHAIHHASRRAGKPYIKVNCAALPETILEAELFGYEKGAFTGAVSRKRGRFEAAHGGTIFLDEVGDFSPTTQVRLLRVIQEREFERLGSVDPIKVDVRIVAATNRDLEAMVEAGTFREDLYYRLNVYPIHLPPLRQRKSDILLLVDHFVAKYAKANHKDVRRVSTPAIDMLLAYHWPGNVRELENTIERAVLVTRDNVIHSHNLPPTLQTAEASDTIVAEGLEAALRRVEREMIVDALKTANGNCRLAAQALGITERIMGLRLKQYAIDYRRFRSGS